MKLEPEKLPLRMLDGRVIGIFAGGHDDEIAGQGGEFVAVRIPDLQGAGESAEEGAIAVVDGEGALAVFTFLALLDFSAEKLGQDLDTVANSEDGNAQVEDGLVGERGVGGVNARWASGEDQAAGLEGGNVRRGSVEAENRGVNMALADAPGDDLGVLGTEI